MASGTGRAQRNECEMAERDELEETLAHLLRALDDLSDVVARQDEEITRLTRRVDLLMAREAEREAEGGGGVALADQRPPHW